MNSLEKEILDYQEVVDHYKTHLTSFEIVLNKLKNAITVSNKELEDDIINKTNLYLTVSIEKQKYLWYNKKDKLVTHNKPVAIVDVSDYVYLLNQIPTLYNNHTTIDQATLIQKCIKDLYQVEKVVLNYNFFKYE